MNYSEDFELEATRLMMMLMASGMGSQQKLAPPNAITHELEDSIGLGAS